MKHTTILFSIIACITLFACNPLKPSSAAVQSSFHATDSIPGTVAFDMITHFHDTTGQVDHSLDSMIMNATLQNSDLYKIFKMKKITRIRLLAAAYLNTDPIVYRRNKLTVLVQLKQGYNSDYYYYDIQSFGDGRICPPPPGCSSFQN
jgi:hypothetical protein